jgi:hypothetical protein
MVAGGVHQIVRATVAECVKRRSPMPAYLVVANQTLGGRQLRQELRRRLEKELPGLGCWAEVDRPFDDKLQVRWHRDAGRFFAFVLRWCAATDSSGQPPWRCNHIKERRRCPNRSRSCWPAAC